MRHAVLYRQGSIEEDNGSSVASFRGTIGDPDARSLQVRNHLVNRRGVYFEAEMVDARGVR